MDDSAPYNGQSREASSHGQFVSTSSEGWSGEEIGGRARESKGFYGKRDDLAPYDAQTTSGGPSLGVCYAEEEKEREWRRETIYQDAKIFSAPGPSIR